MLHRSPLNPGRMTLLSGIWPLPVSNLQRNWSLTTFLDLWALLRAQSAVGIFKKCFATSSILRTASLSNPNTQFEHLFIILVLVSLFCHFSILKNCTLIFNTFHLRKLSLPVGNIKNKQMLRWFSVMHHRFMLGLLVTSDA